MMKLYKYTFIYLLLFVLPCSLIGQTPESRAEEIRSSSQYVYGEGFGKTQSEADDNAFQSLSGSISTYVYNIFVFDNESVTNQDKEDLQEFFQSHSKTGSFANLPNSKQLIIRQGDEKNDFHIMRYIDNVSLILVMR